VALGGGVGDVVGAEREPQHLGEGPEQSRKVTLGDIQGEIGFIEPQRPPGEIVSNPHRGAAEHKRYDGDSRPRPAKEMRLEIPHGYTSDRVLRNAPQPIIGLTADAKHAQNHPHRSCRPLWDAR
jgi:hypothetical protein